MFPWEFTLFSIGFYAVFLLLLMGKLARAPRPVTSWLRRLHTYIELAILGFLLVCDLSIWADSILPQFGIARLKDNPPLLYAFIALAAVWMIGCGFWVKALFKPGSAFCDERIKHGDGFFQKIARWQFEPRANDKLQAAASSDVEDLNLFQR